MTDRTLLSTLTRYHRERLRDAKRLAKEAVSDQTRAEHLVEAAVHKEAINMLKGLKR